MNYNSRDLLGAALTPEQFKSEWVNALKNSGSPKDAMQKVTGFINMVNRNLTAHLEEDGERLDVRVYDISTEKAASANGAYLALFELWDESEITAYQDTYQKMAASLKEMNANYELFKELDPSVELIYKPKTPEYARYVQSEQAARGASVVGSSKKKVPVGLLAAAAAGAAALYFSFR